VTPLVPDDAAVKRPAESTVMFAVVYTPAVTPVDDIAAEFIAPASMFVPAANDSTNVLIAVKFALTSVAIAAVPLTKEFGIVSVAIVIL